MSQLTAICKDATGNNFFAQVVKKKHTLNSRFKQSSDIWHALTEGSGSSV
jgi:hypothetical protein